MIEPSLALQGAVRARLVDSEAVLALVPPSRIFDGRARPEQFPCITFGDGQTVLEVVTLSRKHVRVFLDLHCWTNEGGLAAVKTIAGAVSTALLTTPSMGGLVDFFVAGTRFLRDPTAEIGHAVVSLEALVVGAESTGVRPDCNFDNLPDLAGVFDAALASPTPVPVEDNKLVDAYEEALS